MQSLGRNARYVISIFVVALLIVLLAGCNFYSLSSTASQGNHICFDVQEPMD